MFSTLLLTTVANKVIHSDENPTKEQVIDKNTNSSLFGDKKNIGNESYSKLQVCILTNTYLLK